MNYLKKGGKGAYIRCQIPYRKIKMTENQLVTKFLAIFLCNDVKYSRCVYSNIIVH